MTSLLKRLNDFLQATTDQVMGSNASFYVFMGLKGYCLAFILMHILIVL